MTLTQQAQQYLTDMGLEAAQERFGKTRNTIKAWISTKPPIEVVEAMMDDAKIEEAIDTSAGLDTSSRLDPGLDLIPRESSEPDAPYDYTSQIDGLNDRDYRKTLAIESLTQGWQALEARVRNIENIMLPRTPVNPPLAAPPQVIHSGATSAQAMSGGFTTTKVLGGTNPPPPEPQQGDRYGVSMASLLRKPLNPERRR